MSIDPAALVALDDHAAGAGAQPRVCDPHPEDVSNSRDERVVANGHD